VTTKVTLTPLEQELFQLALREYLTQFVTAAAAGNSAAATAACKEIAGLYQRYYTPAP
jgi:hypothetical protein